MTPVTPEPIPATGGRMTDLICDLLQHPKVQEALKNDDCPECAGQWKVVYGSTARGQGIGGQMVTSGECTKCFPRLVQAIIEAKNPEEVHYLLAGEECRRCDGKGGETLKETASARYPETTSGGLRCTCGHTEAEHYLCGSPQGSRCLMRCGCRQYTWNKQRKGA